MRNQWAYLFIDKSMTIKETMKKMDQASKKVLFVVDRQQRLIGAITDGDIRRWILAEGSLNKKIDKIYNRKPIHISVKASKEKSEEEILKLVMEADIEALPIVNDHMQIVDMFFWKDLAREDSNVLTKYNNLEVPVVIMAGGEGTRLDPFTKILPKALIPIEEQPVAEVILKHFLQYVKGEFTFILGHKAEMIKAYFHSEKKYKISFLLEGNQRLGTAGGLRLLPKDFSTTFFLSNCDTIIKARYDDIYAFHKERKYDITIVGSMQHFVVPYGVMKINLGGDLKQVQEKPEYNFLVNTGMYVMEKKILKYIPRNQAFNLTDLIKKVRKEKGRIGVYPISEKSWFDIGQWEKYNETSKRLVSMAGN